jgi:hypothetical protein
LRDGGLRHAWLRCGALRLPRRCIGPGRGGRPVDVGSAQADDLSRAVSWAAFTGR